MRKLTYQIGRVTEEEGLVLDFRDGLSRSVEDRITLGFIPMKLPVIDDVPYRVFESIAEYRQWLTKSVSSYLGFGSSHV